MTRDRLAATLSLDEAVTKVRLVSPARAKALEKLGIRSIRDLLTHFPRRYIDMSQIESIAQVTIGSLRTVIGTIHEIKLKTPKPRLNLIEIALHDDSGLMIITCFRQPWLMDSLNEGMRIAASGKVEFNYGFKRMTNPFIEKLDEGFDVDTGFITPVHPATEKISTAWMRRLISNALGMCRGLYDPLPIDLRNRYRLLSRQASLSCIHFPQSNQEIEMARRRLVYEELLLLELYLLLQAEKRTEGMTPRTHVVNGARMKSFVNSLPYTLSEEQENAKDDLLKAMAEEKTANHMILGDVGTGKTIVSAFGLIACADSLTQACMMAPTEILARQYGNSLGPYLDEQGIGWAVLTSSTPSSERREILEGALSGDLSVVFGTHALLEEDLVFKDCSLIIIDEQHRFGVEQRKKLLEKGKAPDVVYLTATPIPRSLALALYGDLSLSYIKKRPLNSAGNTTTVLKKDERGKAYDAALAALAMGRQVYVVCPLIGKEQIEPKHDKDDELLGELADDKRNFPSVSIEDESDFDGDNLKAAVQEAEFLQNKVFVDYRVELLHGKMKSTEKNEIMQDFRSAAIQVLVATTVIEVGVDVPNATVMIVEDADRFGLAQLHQLRGRVGRGDLPGEVFLISSSKSELALSRLEAMENTEDGFELALYDLSLRKEGDILGNRQHGSSVLKLVNVVRDGKIIEAAHEDAREILTVDPLLESETYRTLGRELRVVFRHIEAEESLE